MKTLLPIFLSKKPFLVVFSRFLMVVWQKYGRNFVVIFVDSIIVWVYTYNMKTFTTFKIAEILGEKYQRLRGWIDSGAIVPSIRSADGVGVKAQFSRTDIYCIGLFRELLSLGFSRNEAGARTKGLQDYLNLVSTDEASILEHIMIIKYGDTFLAKYELPDHKPVFKRLSAVLKDLKQDPLRMALFTGDDFQNQTMVQLLSGPGFKSAESIKKAIDYTSMVIVNFGRIVREISAQIE